MIIFYVYFSVWSIRTSDLLISFANSRNNGYAISTPTGDQYRGDGIGNCYHFSVFCNVLCFMSPLLSYQPFKISAMLNSCSI